MLHLYEIYAREVDKLCFLIENSIECHLYYSWRASRRLDPIMGEGHKRLGSVEEVYFSLQGQLDLELL